MLFNPRSKKPPADEQDLLTQEQVAVALQVSVSLLQQWRSRGDGPKYLRLSYRTIRYRREDVEAWRKKAA